MQDETPSPLQLLYEGLKSCHKLVSNNMVVLAASIVSKSGKGKYTPQNCQQVVDGPDLNWFLLSCSSCVAAVYGHEPYTY